ncbi:Rv3235 family protein, partial [Streptomyces sp. MA5143a]|uniref:Rv3235 family protein n=1 Tax=Streptomyces sp. MA5143a TaxID=2083010 RepID=UPI000D1B923B
MNKVMTRTQRRPGTRPPVRHDTRRPGRTPARTTPGGGRVSTAARGRTAVALLPEVLTAPAALRPRPTDRFADLLLAVLSGRRPVHSMLRHTAGRAYDELAWLAERGPLRAAHGTDPVIRDIGYYVAAPGALEVFAR